MSHVLLTGLLIALSVISRCDGGPRQFDLLAKTALNLPENIQNKYEVQRLNGEMNAGLCWLCKRTIGELMALAKHEIRKEIKAVCKTFKHFERNCKAQAYKYETMAIHLLFHGNSARDSCKHIHLC
ncbi:hypothetical protein SRHO_G00129530 [Serrasalmus rhombeus]